MYLRSRNRPDSGERTLRDYQRQFRDFAEWMSGHYPELPALRDVSSDIAEEYATYLLSQIKDEEGKIIKAKYTANTYNKHIRVLDLVYRILEGKARIAKNPWTGMTRMKEQKKSRRELNTDEINSIVNNAKGELRSLLILGIYTGMRLGDCCCLRWSEVDLQRNIILRVPNKTARRKNDPVHIPVHPTLFAVLKTTPKSKRKGYVLPGFASKYKKNDSDIAKIMRKHFRDCDIQLYKEGTGKGSGQRAVVEVGFHSLRHSFVSLCREANTPLAVVEAIVGHSNPAMTRHYTHVGDLAASQAVAALPVFTGANGKTIPTTHDMLSPRDQQIMAILEKSTGKTWAKDKKTALKLIRGR